MSFWRFWLLICSLVFSLCDAVHGQTKVFEETFSRRIGEPPAGYVTGWKIFPPVREFNEPGIPEILRDIEAHLPATKSMQAKYKNDPITWGHESVHAVSEVLSREAGPNLWAFYCLRDRGCVLRFPSINKAIVEQSVPQELRGDCWKQYMTGMNPTMPFMILDEWIAFINSAALKQQMYGSQKEVVTSQVQDADGGVTTTSQPLLDTRFAIEFMGYSTVLLQCVEKYDPNYPDLDKLADFIAFNTTRTFALTRLDPQEQLVKVYAQRFFRSGTQQCVNGQCQVPTWSQGQWVREQGEWRSATPTPQPRPVAKPVQQPLVPVVQSPVGCNCSGEIASLKAEIAALKLAAKEPGPAGKDGRDGANGEPVNIDAVASEVLRRLPPIHVQNFARDGKLIDEESYPQGTPIKLRHGVPSKVK